MNKKVLRERVSAGGTFRTKRVKNQKQEPADCGGKTPILTLTREKRPARDTTD